MSQSNSQVSGRSLRRRLVGGVFVGATIVLAVVAVAGLITLKRNLASDSDDQLRNSASLSKQLVDRVLAERTRQVMLMASEPLVIDAAKKGAEQAAKLNLPAATGDQMAPATLEGIEAKFKATHSMEVDPGTKHYLEQLSGKLDIAEVMVTDRYGYNSVITGKSSDFVQSDEKWWQYAWQHDTATTPGFATADPATQRTVVEVSSVVRDGKTDVGVLKVKFLLSIVDEVLSQGSSGDNSLQVDIVDSAGKVIASSAKATRFRALAGFKMVDGVAADTPFSFDGDTVKGASVRQRGVVALTNVGTGGSTWRVLAHMSESDANHAYTAARMALVIGVVAMFALIGLSLLFVSRFIERRITGPAGELAVAAEAVADGDLSKTVSQIGADDEIGRLARAVNAMITELRRLAVALNESSAETTNMTAEITASSEEMAASAGQIAHTAADLSQQANVMAEMISGIATSSEHLVGIAGELDTGAQEGVRRNAQLRALALENRARLDDSSRSLATLSADVEANAASIERLAEASEEIRTFVSLVQKLARQSKLLALNAAMEAARAGEHGHGFAVVAEEVRRLSAMSSDAAEKTERVVSSVLQGISQSRNASERTVDTVRGVRSATEEGSRSFGHIETAVAEADQWTGSIQRAATGANNLAREMRGKMDSLATGTESFAAAMEEVAASSEEQSASTEQIAAAAGTLSGAAERLTKLVSNLRLDHGVTAEWARSTTPPVRVPRNVAIGRATPVKGNLIIKTES